jgi:hypothetical protein
MGYNSIAWLPLTAGLTAIGVIISYFAWRRHGTRAALHGVAWSLLPIAAYLTGSIEMFWKIATAIGDFGSGFVFSPVKWAGIGVAGLAAALFLTTGGRRRRKAARLARKEARTADQAEAGRAGSGSTSLERADGATQTLPAARLPERTPAPAKKPAKAGRGGAADDDDMKDIEDILRKRGL